MVIDSTRAFAIRLMEHLVVPTFVLDAERRVVIWNRTCERLTGIPASEILGTRQHWSAFYDEPRYCLADILALGCANELDALYAAHTEPSETGEGLRAENWCTMPHTGKRLYLAIDAGPIYDDEGRLIAVVETLRDMTEQKLAQIALQRLAERDGLTGIANRRRFDDSLELEFLRAQREQRPLSLILADVDFFKRYNDHYGHQEGDACLKQVASALESASFRPTDLVARYGGEEFAILMPYTDEAGATAVAERVVEQVRRLGLAHAASEAASHVTVSLGVVTLLPEEQHSSADLLKAADQALYAAKHAGRDRFVCGAVTETLREPLRRISPADDLCAA
ncbi:diguanylate cyclase [Dechloromonas sp. ZS-1]|uniref:sensor domain-containing diguanylate cyclase n=1 Tax=Dechloromonas sp. ZS-1 TaxID=3138067 RepID=UPI0031FD43AD